MPIQPDGPGRAALNTTWWVYETIYGRVRVHYASCSFCKDGRGLFGKGNSPTGKWRGPYKDLRTAWDSAYDLDKADTDACGHCKPYPPVHRTSVERLLSGGYRLLRTARRIERVVEKVENELFPWLEEMIQWQGLLPPFK